LRQKSPSGDKLRQIETKTKNRAYVAHIWMVKAGELEPLLYEEKKMIILPQLNPKAKIWVVSIARPPNDN
jgi:hypothetical protein